MCDVQLEQAAGKEECFHALLVYRSMHAHGCSCMPGHLSFVLRAQRGNVLPFTSLVCYLASESRICWCPNLTQTLPHPHTLYMFGQAYSRTRVCVGTL